MFKGTLMLRINNYEYHLPLLHLRQYYTPALFLIKYNFVAFNRTRFWIFNNRFPCKSKSFAVICETNLNI
ncbi:hypothetical protein CW304_25900 [Bacillus sp. UFRGS-B20]|nr:hypothetical protein CW304_25900 [Bacillus sp. UFRGS-B20]